MLTVCKLAHWEEYKSANTSSRGRDGTVLRTLCNCLRTMACEEVSNLHPKPAMCTFHYRKFGTNYRTWAKQLIVFNGFTHALRTGNGCVTAAHFSSSLTLLAATKETSFVHAISAAGVMYTLTKNCSMGDFDNCGCDDSRIGQTGTFLQKKKKKNELMNEWMKRLVYFREWVTMCCSCRWPRMDLGGL